jgi:hypothetical protein
MPAASETRAAERPILLVGPYGVLGTEIKDLDSTPMMFRILWRSKI